MSRHTVRITARCPECHEPAEVTGGDLLVSDVAVFCARCKKDFSAALIPGAKAAPAPAITQPPPRPREQPHTPGAGPAAARRAPIIEEDAPELEAIKPDGEADAAPFQPVGVGPSLQAPPRRPSPAPPHREGRSAGKGFNSLPQWLQYTILVVLVVGIGVGIFLSPLGESGSADEKDDPRPEAKKPAPPAPKKPAGNNTEEPILPPLDLGPTDKKPKDAKRKDDGRVPDVPFKSVDKGGAAAPKKP